jgi:hypothetical protein
MSPYWIWKGSSPVWDSGAVDYIQLTYMNNSLIIQRRSVRLTTSSPARSPSSFVHRKQSVVGPRVSSFDPIACTRSSRSIGNTRGMTPGQLWLAHLPRFERENPSQTSLLISAPLRSSSRKTTYCRTTVRRGGTWTKGATAMRPAMIIPSVIDIIS